jgi:hypothetical protein
MCRTAQWRLTQTESKRRPVPGAFFRLPVRWVMQRGPDGLLAQHATKGHLCCTRRLDPPDRVELRQQFLGLGVICPLVTRTEVVRTRTPDPYEPVRLSTRPGDQGHDNSRIG